MAGIATAATQASSMSPLMDALREALSVAAETDPRELSAEELTMLNQLDQRAFQIMDTLIREHDEAGPAARAAIARAMLK